MKNAKPNPVDENGEWEGCGVSEQRAIDWCMKMAKLEGDAEIGAGFESIDTRDIQEIVRGIPELTEQQIAVGAAAIDAYYDNTKDAPFEGGVAFVYRAMKALEPKEAISSVDFQQQRGAAWDIIDEALLAYQGFMLDDDYDAQAALDRIMERMRERRLAHGRGQS